MGSGDPAPATTKIMERIIKITIGQDGQASIDADGFKGESCKDATKAFEEVYGQKVSYQDKPELHEAVGPAVRIGAAR